MPYDFLKFIFLRFIPQVRLFFRNKKGNLKFRIQECDGERDQKNSHFRNDLNCIASKIFGKIKLKP